ncbi:SDR family oxidoreductase [uncultured Novosphingobium sp.]|uniref:SDR family NAD(P)-dependent oxidoreductase n=1 Tax=uncultured Novosphingobium sp. TaxID=292277 RepID=UPI00258FA016|nr:SDR family oxidoreductase [uncultured Novosphingobium sp.]
MAETRGAGGEAIADVSDVSTHDGVRALVDHAMEVFGQLDIIVANAGTITYDTPPEDLRPEPFASQFALMVTGVGLLVGAAWPHLVRSGAGRIVLTSSAGATFGSHHNAYYTAAKTAVVGITRAFALDGEGLGIKTNAICPLGMSHLFEGFSTDEIFNRWFEDNARPEAVAPMVAYLAHADCAPSKRVFSTGLGHVSEIFTGLTKGWHQAGHTPEDIRDQFTLIEDRSGYTVPMSALESTGAMFRDAPLPTSR